MELQLQSESTKPNARIRTATLSLDDYLSFVVNRKQINLTVNLLNQVIHMHGFKKLHRTQKKVMIDAVDSIDLMDPTRSSLNDESVSSRAFVTLEEAVKDLADLNWQECCVTSIQTLNSVNYDFLALQNDANASSSKSKPKMKTPKRLKLLTQRDVDGEGAATAHGRGGSGCSQSACSSVVDGGAPKR